MKGTVTEKILLEHLVEGKLEPGNEIAIEIKDSLTQDATGTMTWMQFETTGVSKVKTRAVSFIDHNTVQMGFENADDHDYLDSTSEKYGAILSKAGNGICHQLFLERFAIPGRTMLGADSHTPTAGGVGQLAIGVGGLDVALAMAGQLYRLKAPEVIGVYLTGKLNNWTSAKDVIITLIEQLGTKNKNKIIEYVGGGVNTLSVPERSTITNMGAELGVTTSIFPSDKITLEFLTLMGRKNDYKKITAESDAQYNKIIQINLENIVPMAVLPPEPGIKGLGKPRAIEEIINKKVNQVCVGACTNSSYHDLMILAKCLEGKKVHKDVELTVTPGSRAVMQLLIKNGGYASLVEAGARITEPVCGPCIGQGYSPRSGGVRVSTFNRNFCGRSGTKDDKGYLVSPESAAAAAITGEIRNPKEIFSNIDYQRFMPKTYPIINSLFIFNQGNKNAEIIKGPNIAEVPKNKPLTESLEGIATIKLGDHITTDDICPAGQWLKYRSNIPLYSQATFNPIDPKFHIRASEQRDKGIANIVIAGDGYGEGSSREHAAICPMYLGVKVVVAKGFQRIHSDNLVNFGIMPLQFANPGDYEKINQNDQIKLNNLHERLKNNNLILETDGMKIPLKHELSQRQVDIVLVGGALNYLK